MGYYGYKILLHYSCATRHEHKDIWEREHIPMKVSWTSLLSPAHLERSANEEECFIV